MPSEVVVVGAGPAGSCAAYHLARAGIEVLLVDRSDFPRPKACGDGLTPRAFAALDRMGLRTLWQRSRRIDGIRLIDYRTGADAEVGFDATYGPVFGGVLRRDELDHELMLRAGAAGARVLTKTTATHVEAGPSGGVTVRLTGPTGQWSCHARFAVIGDGVSGRLSSRLLGRTGRSSVDLFAARQYFETTSDPGRHFEVHAPLMSARGALPGYAWLFPVGDGVVNVGVGFARLLPVDANLRHVFDDALRALAERGVSLGAPCGPLVGAPIPIGLDPEGSVGNGWLVIGDSAGVANPFTGEGIAQALESGELAAESVARAIRKGSDIAGDYPRLLDGHFPRRRRLQPSLAELFGAVRTYERHEAASHVSNVRSAAARAVRNIFLDRHAGLPSETWLRLTAGVDAPALWTAFDDVGRRVASELAGISPVFAETVGELRTDETICGYGAALVLSAALTCDGIDEYALRAAELVELVALQRRLHGEIPAHLDGLGPATSFSVLLGDAIVARLFAVLNGFERHSAQAISRVLREQAAETATRELQPAVEYRYPLGAAFVAHMVGSVAAGSRPAAHAPLEAWARDLVEAVDIALAGDRGEHAHAWPAHARQRANDATDALAGAGLGAAALLNALTRNVEALSGETGRPDAPRHAVVERGRRALGA